MVEENIVSMRKSLQKLLKAKSLQSSSPAGFASCLKMEPMTLEDAHGNLIPIPIDLMGSWEVSVVTIRRDYTSQVANFKKEFENILTSHFRTLLARGKVLRREYATEDSATRSTFSRSQPWSTFSKPGRKIDMSMIFRNAGNTVVCPKCNAISKENEGYLVEW